jgi:hypothetical protein
MAKIDGKRMTVGGAHLLAANLETFFLRTGDQRANLFFAYVVKALLHHVDDIRPRRETLAVER